VAERLVACAEAAFWAAMRVARAGRPLQLIGRAVEGEVRRRGFSVVRELAGHGVGRAIHERPEVLNFCRSSDRTLLTDGLVLAVEPMVAAGRGGVTTRGDGWTIGTRDGSLSAHFEHTVVITRGKPLILTA
jgi:methionyl aminopeptidase